MCGIFGYICSRPGDINLDSNLLTNLVTMGNENRHRGPDCCNIREVKDEKYYICAQFHRLSIVGIEKGDQPFISKCGGVWAMVNGEIYNYRDLQTSYNLEMQTTSDCEVIIRLYEKYGIEQTINVLDGVWSFVIYDMNRGMVHFARDIWGVRPLHYATGINDTSKLPTGIRDVAVSSTAKCLNGYNYEWVEPRKIYTLKTRGDGLFDLSITPYVDFKYRNISDSDKVIGSSQYQGMLNNGDNIPYLFKEAVRKRIQKTERPVGFFLSGGLDSSLTLAVAMEIRRESLDLTPIDVFSIGTKGSSPDLSASQSVVSYLKNKYGEHSIIHHIVDFRDWNYDTLDELIYNIETPDVTTIRASMPMYLLSRYVRDNTKVKIIISGEGSDELFGGYLYFKNAPSDVEFEKESRRLLLDLYKFDVLRCDRSVSVCGLEVRVPFLDRDFSTYVLDTETHMKMSHFTNSTPHGIGKYLLRKSFEGVLPDDILWRIKDGMSDGVGKKFQRWVKEYAMDWYCDYDNSPIEVEKKLYREIYNSYYSRDLIKYQWMPKWVDSDIDDPSGTLLM